MRKRHYPISLLSFNAYIDFTATEDKSDANKGIHLEKKMSIVFQYLCCNSLLPVKTIYLKNIAIYSYLLLLP